MLRILLVTISLAAATYKGPSDQEIKEACYSNNVDKANCASVLAKSIVSHSRDCFSSSAGEESGFKTCCTGFCNKQCGGNEACSGLCSQKAVGLFDKLKPAAAMIKVAQHLPIDHPKDTLDQYFPPNKTQPLPKVPGSISAKAEKKAPAPKTAAPKVNHPVDTIDPAKHSFMQRMAVTKRAPEDELAKEMTHDLEMNFNKIAPFGKEDTAKELQDHAAKTQDTLVDAVENAEVAEIKRAVFRALTRLRAATIKEFDTIARLETQAIDAYNDAHHYRAENPLAHLHEDEAPVETDKLKSFH